MQGMRSIGLAVAFFLCIAFMSVSPAAAAWTDVTPADKSVKKRPESVNFSLFKAWNNAHVLTFSEPMVPREAVGKSLGGFSFFLGGPDFPFTVTPDLGWSGEWLDQSTLQLKNPKALPLATTIRYTPKENAKSLAGRPLYRIKEYLPYPFQLADLRQTRYEPDGSMVFAFRFRNGKVAPDALKKHLKISHTVQTGEKKETKELPALAVTSEGGESDALLFVTVKPEGFPQLEFALSADLASVDGPTPLGAAKVLRITPSSLLSVERIDAYQDSSPPWNRSIRLRFSGAVKAEYLPKYLELAPNMGYVLAADSPRDFRITGDFTTRPRVSVTVQKGLPNQEHTGSIPENHTDVVTFEDFTPSLALGEQGSTVSPNRPMRLPLTTINVDRVGVTLRELPENSIPLMVMGFYDSYRSSLARVVTSRTADVGGVLNRIAERSIDLKDIAGERKGIFFLTAVDASRPENMPNSDLEPPSRDTNVTGAIQEDSTDEDDHDGESRRHNRQRKAQKLIVISDIGIVGRLMPDRLTIWANSIASAEPYAEARVRVYSNNNILLAEGRTDKDGLYRADLANGRLADGTPALVLVSTPPKPADEKEGRSYDDMAFLKLDTSLTVGKSFDTGGKPYLTDGYEAFCYTPRGVYRPGETVPVRALVRDAAMKAPEPFPVTWKVFASTGRTAGQGVGQLSPSGGLSFSLELVPAAPTGEYRAEVYLPGQEHLAPLGTVSFAVEDLQPPRIEIALTPSSQTVSGDDALIIGIEAKYLFGTPASEAPWEASLAIHPLEFSHPDWKAFNFPPQPTRYTSGRGDAESGALDNDGKATIRVKPGEEYGETAQAFMYTVRVQEDGGRWVAKSIRVPYFPKPVLLGYELPRQDFMVNAGGVIRLAAVTPEGRPAASKSLKAKVVFEKEYHTRSEYGYTSASEDRVVMETDVPLENGVGALAFTPKDEGWHRIMLLDEHTGAEQEFACKVWAPLLGSETAEASPLIDRVMLSWDKPSYTPGETAKLAVRSPFPGKLFLTVENNTERLSRILVMGKAEETISLPVSEEMGPNAYCTVWVIRPVKEGEKWGAHRAFGLIPLMLNKASANIAVAIEAPDTFRPKADLPVTVILKDHTGAPVAGEVTVALIDEGLLNLTGHKTPDPFAFFSAKRAMVGKSFDRYDELMPLSSRPPVRFEAGGDDEMRDSGTASPVTRKLELLTIVQETVPVGVDGTVNAVLSLPEYSGRGRLMVVAASPSGVGSAASGIRIARDVTIEATAPRMVSPGDTFLMPVIAYATGSGSRSAKITVTAEGPLEVQGANTFSVRLGDGVSKQTLTVPVKALNESALAVLRVAADIDGAAEQAFEHRIEVPVRPPFARQTLSGTGVIRGDSPAAVTVPGGFYPGSQRARLSFADSPGVSLATALEYLREYPNGCLEQTVSTTWPYIGAPMLLRATDPDLADNDAYKKGLDYGIRRILSMQRPDGSFSMWPGENSYNNQSYAWGSAYATHLLLEARNLGTGLVPADAYMSAIKWLKRYISSPLRPSDRPGYGIGYELSTRAYIAFVLAMHGEPPLGWMQFLSDQGNTLNVSARIFLAGAYAKAEGTTDALKRLGDKPFTTGGHGWSHETPVRNEALRLLMWVHIDPFAPETGLFATRIAEAADQGLLTNTQENAVAVLALGKYLEKTAGSGEAYTAIITGQEGTVREFGKGDAPSLDTPALLANGKPETVTVAIQGKGGAKSNAVVYYKWLTSGVPLTPPADEENGMRLFRRWSVEDTNRDFFEHDKEKGFVQKMPEFTAAQGEKINVTLYIEAPDDMTSLVLTDIAPGGFEIENPRLVPKEGGEDSYSSYNPELEEDWARANDSPPFGRMTHLNGMEGVRVEIRDDRLVLFINQVPKRSVFTYSLRAVSKGRFVMPPLAAEGMYDTKVNARTMPGKAAVVTREEAEKLRSAAPDAAR